MSLKSLDPGIRRDDGKAINQSFLRFILEISVSSVISVAEVHFLGAFAREIFCLKGTTS